MPTKRKAKGAPPPNASSRAPNKKPRYDASQNASAEAFHHDDTDHSVLGGLSGGYRITGDEPGSDPTITVFKVPFNDKFIVCEHRAKEVNAATNEKSRPKRDTNTDKDEDEDEDAEDTSKSTLRPRLIFTHGAGGGVSNPATASFMDGFSEVSPVVCFQGTMNLQSRVKTFHAVIESQGFAGALGGRSMGARAAVMTANEKERGDVRALVLVSYPLVGGKKGDVRDGILKELDQGIDVLFVIGGNDGMCDIEQLGRVRGEMSAQSWLLEVKEADHGMSIKDKRGVEELRKKTGAVAAEWLRTRDQKKRYCFVTWDGDASQAVGGEWLGDGDRQDEISAPKSRRKQGSK